MTNADSNEESINDAIEAKKIDSIDQDELKAEIRQTLEKEKLPLSWLAEKIGLSHGTVRNWFYSKVRITDDNIEKINGALSTFRTSQKFSGGIGDCYLYTTREGAIEEWLVAFEIFEEDERDNTFSDILDDAAKEELVVALKGKSIQDFRNIPLANVLFSGDVPRQSAYIFLLPSESECFMWRKAASLSNMSLNDWANSILENRSAEILKKSLGLK